MDGQEGDWYTSDGDIFPIHGAVMTPENPRREGQPRIPDGEADEPFAAVGPAAGSNVTTVIYRWR